MARWTCRSGLRIALIVCSIIVTLGAAEFVLRAIPSLGAPRTVSEDPDDALWADPDWRGPPPRVFTPDPVLGYAYAPEAVADIRVAEHKGGAFRFRTNRLGLRRDGEVVIPKPAETFRVVVLGDSQTSGYSTNAETYPGRLEARWQARYPGREIEVINAGIDGYTPQQAYLWYRERGAPLAADVVVLAFYAGNDVADIIYGVDGAVIDADAGLIGPSDWLGLHSHLVRRVGPPLEATLARLATTAGVMAAPQPIASQDTLIRLMRECHGCWFQSYKQAVRARTDPPRMAQAYRRIGLLVQLLDARVRSQGGRFAVLIIPTKTQVEPEDEKGAIGRSVRLLGLNEQDRGYDDVAYAGVRAAVAGAGAVLIDPLDGLRHDGRARRLYYRRDWHLNVDGNQALADAVDRALVGAGLAP